MVSYPHSIMVFHIEDAGNVFASAQGTGREGGRAASFSSRQDAPVFERGDRRPLMKRKRRKKHMLLPPFSLHEGAPVPAFKNRGILPG